MGAGPGEGMHYERESDMNPKVVSDLSLPHIGAWPVQVLSNAPCLREEGDCHWSAAVGGSCLRLTSQLELTKESDLMLCQTVTL